MDQKEKREQKAALEHALAALSDGSGHEVWGPGPIGRKLWEHLDVEAATAFDRSAQALFASGVGMALLDRPRFIAGMRKLAPILLDILLGE